MSGRRTRQRQQPGRDGHAEEDRTHDNNRPDVDPPHPDPHPADGNVLLEIVDIEELEEEEEDDYDDSEQDFDTEDELVDIEGDFSDEDYRGREPATIHHVRRQRGDPLQVQYIDIEIPLAFFGRGIGTQQASQGSQGSAAPRPVFTMQGMFGSGGVRGVTTRVQPGQGAEQHSGATGTSATAAPAPAPASRYELRDRASRPAPRYQFRTRRPAAAQPSRSINTPIFLPGNPHEPIVVRGRDDRGATFRLPGANENLFVPRVNQDNYAEVLANVLFHVMMASGHGPGGGMPHLQGQPPASETARRALPSLGVELERGRALKCPSCSICMEEFAIEGNVTKETSSSLSSASTSRPLNQSNSQGQAQSSASTTLPPSLPSQTIRAMPCHHLFHEGKHNAQR